MMSIETMQSWLLGYLVNAAWQAVVILTAAWLLARVARRLGPLVEHRLWVTALLAEVVLPALTVRPVHLLWGESTGVGRALVTVVTGAGVAHAGLRISHAWLMAAVLLYGCVVAIAAARLLWGMVRTMQLARRAQTVELDGPAAETWQRTCRWFGVETTGVRATGEVGGPVTVGAWRRLLILPRGFTAETPETELAAAMAHECAHMARQDFAKNLLYEALRLPLAWHPAVWATRLRLTASREMVCDALAAEFLAGTQGYAKALLGLARRMVSAPVRNVHAIGIFDANGLEERVMRLMNAGQQITGVRRAVLVAACVAAGLGTCALAAESRTSVAVPQDAPAAGKGTTVPAGVMAGQIESQVMPKYPPIAKAAKVSGAVVLDAVIAKDGSMKSLHVLSGPDMLRGSALEAVSKWKYKPYLLNGEPTEVETTITVTYNLPPAPPTPPDPSAAPAPPPLPNPPAPPAI